MLRFFCFLQQYLNWTGLRTHTYQKVLLGDWTGHIGYAEFSRFLPHV